MNHLTLIGLALGSLGCMAATPANESSAEPITNPEGRKQLCSTLGRGIEKSWVDIIVDDFSAVAEIVYGDDGKTVYISRPITPYPTTDYLKGTLSDDGKTVTCQLPQLIENYEYYEGMYFPTYVSLMNREGSGEEFLNYLPEEDPTQNVITYTVGDDGSLKMTPIQEDWEYETDPNYGYEFVKMPPVMLGLYCEVPASIAYYEPENPDEIVPYWYIQESVIWTEYTPLNTDNLQVVPDGLVYDDNYVAESEFETQFISVAWDGNDVFFKGMMADDPEIVVKGTFADGMVTVPNGAMVGFANNGEFVYLLHAMLEDVYDPDYGSTYQEYRLVDTDFVMDYDPDTKTFVTTDEGSALLINNLPDEVCYFDAWQQPVIRYQSPELVNAAPGVPTISSFEWSEDMQRYQMYIYFNYTNVNGAVQKMDRMYFRTYINDELFTYKASTYEFDTDMTLLPTIVMSPNWDIMLSGPYGYVNYYMKDIESIGVSQVYIDADGNEYEGEKAIWGKSGIDNAAIDSEIVSVTCYDMAGREITNPQPGSIVIRVTRYADGTITRAKTLL